MSVLKNIWLALARMSPWRGISWLLRLCFWSLAILGFFYVLGISDETILLWCNTLTDVVRYVRRVFTWPSQMSGAQALAGILILVPAGILVLVQVWHWVFHRHTADMSGRFHYATQQSQDAIEEEESDELGRGPFVKHLASILLGDIAGSHALYIGLHGEWGEGKTSVLNLVRRKLAQNSRIVFVDFCSWEHEDKKDLPYVLFSRIARTVADRLDLRLAFLLFRYAILLVPRRLISIAGPFEWIIDLTVRFLNAITTTERMRLRIEQRIESLDAKIIVVVDDMDRLEPDDIRSLLRILRTSGDLSQFVYCLLVSRNYLIKGVAKSGKKEMSQEEAEDYIQKIVQLELDLPPVQVGVRQEIFARRLQDVLHGYGLPTFCVRDALVEYFRFYIRNYRSMIRLINRLIVRIGYYRAAGQGELPVNLEDLIVLSIMNMYDTDFWRRLFVYRDTLQGDSLNRLVGDRKLDADHIWRLFGLGDKRRGALRVAFLRDYMGVTVFDNGQAKSANVNVDQREAEQERRLKAAKCFLAYYNGEVPSLPEIGFRNKVLSSLSDEDELISLFKSQNERGLLGPSLDYLEDIPLIENRELRGNYLRALVRMADMRFKAEAAFGRDPLGIENLFEIGTRLSRCINFMLRKLPAIEGMTRGAEFLEVAKATEAIVIMTHAVRWDDRKSRVSRDNEYFFREDEYNELVREFLVRIKKLQRTGELIGYVDEENLRRTWRVLFMEGRLPNEEEEIAEYKRLMAGDIVKYPNVLHALLPYRSYGDRPVEDCSPMWFERLDKELDMKTIVKTLNAAIEAHQEGWLRKLVENFNLAVRIHEEKGVWLHPDDQERFRSEVGQGGF